MTKDSLFYEDAPVKTSEEYDTLPLGAGDEPGWEKGIYGAIIEAINQRPNISNLLEGLEKRLLGV